MKHNEKQPRLNIAMCRNCQTSTRNLYIDVFLHQSFWVICCKCGAHGPTSHESYKHAVQLWNKMMGEDVRMETDYSRVIPNPVQADPEYFCYVIGVRKICSLCSYCCIVPPVNEHLVFTCSNPQSDRYKSLLKNPDLCSCGGWDLLSIIKDSLHGCTVERAKWK